MGFMDERVNVLTKRGPAERQSRPRFVTGGERGGGSGKQGGVGKEERAGGGGGETQRLGTAAAAAGGARRRGGERSLEPRSAEAGWWWWWWWWGGGGDPVNNRKAPGYAPAAPPPEPGCGEAGEEKRGAQRRAAGSGAREPGRAPNGGGCAEPRGAEASRRAERLARSPQPPAPGSHELPSAPAEPPEQPPGRSPPALLGFPAPPGTCPSLARRTGCTRAQPLLSLPRFLASPAGPCKISAPGCMSRAERGAPLRCIGSHETGRTTLFFPPGAAAPRSASAAQEAPPAPKTKLQRSAATVSLTLSG
ncbi:basic proline-rich protein-like [Aquila chrysaetos chrysaetos]|uniref:basic proline-rich protein-like n=1 Tax=Aquila chrysaetos chrysaetos TaxID=223781 RepID=UPI0011771591|nr:basic proline-rich protein-like [Aquila chrysaetos chrysaetos]